jgi:hypothetical protein
MDSLLRELRHLSTAGGASRTHHVAALRSLFHRGLIVGHSLLLLTFHAKHFGQ